MMLGTILLVVLILLLLGSFPLGLGYNASWGYGPSGIIGVILLVVIVLFIAGRL